MPPNQPNPTQPADQNLPGDQPTPPMSDPLQTADTAQVVPQSADATASAAAPFQPEATNVAETPNMDGAAYGQGSFQPAETPQPAPSSGTMPDPVNVPPATPAASAVPPTVPTETTPPTTPVAPGVVSAPSSDPSQPGYVPPAVSPAATPSMQPSHPGNKSKLVRIAIVAVVGLFLFAGGGYLVKDALFSGSQIKTSDLVDDSAENVSFKRPTDWTKASDSRPGQTAYTEQGKSTDETDQVLLVSSQSIGTNYDNLSDADKTKFYDQVKNTFADKSSFEDETCQEASTPEVSKISLPNYTDGVSISVTCEKFSKRNVRAKMKMVIGLKERRMSLVAILAVDKTWDKSGDTFDEILTSFKPAEE